MFKSQAISFCATSQLSFYYGLYNNHNNNIYNLKVNRIKRDQPYLKMFQAASDFKTSPYGILILSPRFGDGGGGGGGVVVMMVVMVVNMDVPFQALLYHCCLHESFLWKSP